jgi:regulator of protease activity HflC (stomatin/prohibitin superfamily)
MNFGGVVIVLIILVLVLIAANIKIVPQAHAYVIEELGAFKTIWGVGLHVKIPFIDTIARKVDLKEQYCDFPPQPVITQDNVTMQIDSIVFFKISDPKAYAYGVRNPIGAIENLTATTLRNVIGSLTLDETLTSRDNINAKMQDALDIATDPWGIKITRVELKNINPPAQIVDSMEKQMKAEREKREKILIAEGEKQSAITVAEGQKQSKILQAEADKQATILHAEAEKEKKIREAEGQAQAIKAVKNAEAEGIKMLKEAGADDSVLTLKSLEAFEKAADGQATKIIVPSNLQGIAGLTSTIKEIAGKQ